MEQVDSFWTPTLGFGFHVPGPYPGLWIWSKSSEGMFLPHAHVKVRGQLSRPGSDLSSQVLEVRHRLAGCWANVFTC